MCTSLNHRLTADACLYPPTGKTEVNANPCTINIGSIGNPSIWQLKQARILSPSFSTIKNLLVWESNIKSGTVFTLSNLSMGKISYITLRINTTAFWGHS